MNAMLSSIVKGIASFKNPLVLIPALLVAVIQAAVFFFAIEPFLLVFLDALNENLPNADPLQLPFVLYQRYFNEFNVLLLAWLVGLALQLWLLFVLSRYVKEQSVGKSLSYAWKRKGSVLSSALFLLLIAFLLFSLYMLFSWISNYSATASQALTLLLAIVALFAAVKLSFFIPSMALDGVKLKEGLQRSWRFSQGRFWPIVLLLLVAWLIANAFNAIALTLTQSVESDLLALAVSAMLSTVAATWVGIAIGHYYSQATPS